MICWSAHGANPKTMLSAKYYGLLAIKIRPANT